MTHLSRHGVSWELDPAFAPELEAVLVAAGEVIKESPDKRVDRCKVGGKIYYRKYYRHGRHLWRPFKYHFKPTQARQEWRLAAAMETRGVPVVRHLALGERQTWRGVEESILVTEGFAGEPITRCDTKEAMAILAFVRRMHEAGVIQHDLHGANLLRNPATGEMRLVDLYGSEVRETVSRVLRAHNLATLGMTLPLPLPPEVARESRCLRGAALEKRSRRVWKHNRDFAPRRVGGLQWQVRQSRMTERLEGILADPDGFLEGRSRSLKKGRSSTVGAGSGFVLKRYNFKKPLNVVKDLVRGSRGRRAMRKAYHLELAGVRTARAVAAATRRILGFPWVSYFVMEEIPSAQTLDRDQNDPEETGRSVGRLLGRLHEEGFVHRDLKPANLVRDQGGTWYLIDLEGLQYAGTVELVQARSDLQRLHRGMEGMGGVVPCAMRSFLKAYCSVRRLRVRDLAGGRRQP